ncbi:MAG: D-aminoacylase, partial [Verrucomicrobiota bacterium]
MDFDLKIINGRVFDGSGATETTGDIGITGDTIAAIGDLGKATANETIDAAECIVCPGFIDAHSHSDAYLLIEPSAAPISSNITCS